MRPLLYPLAIVVFLLVLLACESQPVSVTGEDPEQGSAPLATESHDDAEPRPLPPPVGDRQPEELPDLVFRIWPNSAPVEQGVPYRIRVGTHCELGPIDFDGSFWEAETDLTTADLDLPDPEDSGEISLESQDVALYISSTGAEITLTRMDDEFVDLDACA